MSEEQVFRFEISVWDLACVEPIVDKEYTELDVATAEIVGEKENENIAVELKAEVEE